MLIQPVCLLYFNKHCYVTLCNAHLFLRNSASVYAPHANPETAYTDLSPSPYRTHKIHQRMNRAELVWFDVPLDTYRVILGTSASKQSTALILTTNKKDTKTQHVTAAETLPVFCSRLKTNLFRRCFP